MKLWKLTILAVKIPVLFFIISCQDQLAFAQTDASADYLPPKVKEQFEQFRKSYPGLTFIVEFNQYANDKLKTLEKAYGHAAHIELFTIEENTVQKNYAMIQYAIEEKKEETDRTPQGTITYNLPQPITGDGEVFNPKDVDNGPVHEDGYKGLMQLIGKELKYPEKARLEKKEGTIFVYFVIEKDGSVSNVSIIRGIDPDMDEEASRVVKLTRWIPGNNKGEPVRVKFMLPIRYKL